MPITLADISSILKLRIGVAIAASAMAGMAVTAGPAQPAWKAALLALAVIGASGAAGAFNHYVERDTDRLMARTAGRPFARGALSARSEWLWAIALLLVVSVAVAVAVAGPVAAAHVFLGAFTYGVVYTVWLKRRSVLNIVVGGLAGSFAVLAGAAMVDPQPQVIPIVLAVVLFLWTPPHFWSLAAALRDDYARAGVPMLPLVVGDRRAALVIFAHTGALVALSLVPWFLGLGPAYGLAALAGGALFVWRSWCFVRAPSRRTAMANFFSSLVQLTLLLAGAMADPWLGGGP